MIFCVEDEYNIRELITYSMQAIGFEARGLADGKELFQALGSVFPKLILLDIMLPDLDGLEVLTKLKDNPKTKHIPIILLTAKGAECDKVKGLDLGADDYITKPFSIMELVARVKAVLRRAGQKEKPENVLNFADIVLDLEKHEAKSGGEPVILTSMEFELLKKLMSNPECVISRNTLLEEVWGVNYYGETRTVDAHIKTLRQKLGRNGNKIETIRGRGYKMCK